MNHSNRKFLLPETSTRNVQRICKIISVIFSVCIGFLVVWWMISLSSMISLLIGIDGFENSEVSPLGLTLYIYHCIVIAALLIVLQRAFAEVAKGKSPFTLTQVKRLRIIAVLLLFLSVIEIAISVIAPSLYLDQPTVSTSAANDSLIITIDFMPLIAAAVVYAFSFVFEYGVLLQEDSDEVI